jgi:hypothetical protein
LKRLNLSNNRIGEVGVVALGKALSNAQGSNQTLDTLLLNMNSISDDAGAQFFAELVHNTTLEVVDLSANQLGVKTLQAISQLVVHNVTTGLKKLFLNCNTFNANSKQPQKAETLGKMLYEAVSINKHIINIDLRSTDIAKEFSDNIHGICKE